MDYSILLGGIALSGWFIIIFGGAYGVAVIARGLAKSNLFFTLVNEGEAKAILQNQQFDHFVMAFQGHEFRRNVSNDIAANTLDPTDDWDIVEPPRPENLRPKTNPVLKFVSAPVRLIKSVFVGLHWVGIPPFASVYKHSFSWTSFTEVPQPDGTLRRTPVPVEKEGDNALDYILVQGDQYYTKVEAAECKDNIPLDLELIIYGETVNPYKSLFRIEQWLEATTNIVAARMRDFVGSKTYVELRETTTNGGDMSTEIDLYFKDSNDLIEKKYGFRISKTKIINVGPGSDLAKDFIRASTEIYVAEQVAHAKVATAKGDAESINVVAAAEAKRATSVYGAITAAGGEDMYKFEQIAKSHLTTFVEGGKKKTVTAIPVGGTTPPDAQQQNT